MGLVRDINSNMAQLPPLFKDSQKLDKSELVYSLANNAPRTHKAMLISQGFDPETADLETFVEHCERTETTDDIAGARFAGSDEDNKPRKKSPQVQVRAWEEMTEAFLQDILLSPWREY